MTKQLEIFNKLKECSEARTFTIPSVLVSITGNYDTTIILSQLLQWSNNNNWISKTYKEWEKETLLKEGSIRRSLTKLIETELIKKKVFRTLTKTTCKYLVNTDIILNKVKAEKDNNQSKLKQSKIGFIYIFKCNKFYKIGKSKNPTKRLRSIQASIPYKLEIILKTKVNDCDKTEKIIHKLFKNKIITGEWFKLTQSDITKIKLILQKESI